MEVARQRLLAALKENFLLCSYPSTQPSKQIQSARSPTGYKVPYSPIIRRSNSSARRNNLVTRAEDDADDVAGHGVPKCANSKTDEACGVEENVSALQSQLPPPQLKKSTRKRMPEKISNMVDAIQQGGPGCADSETEAARGVEAIVSALQSQFHPSQLKKSKKKDINVPF